MYRCANRSGLSRCLFLVVVALIVPQTLAAQARARGTEFRQQTDGPGDDEIVINTDLISLTVSVTDTQGHNLLGLEKSAFTVLDDNVPQEIPVSIGLIFDTSGSMSGAKIVQARGALAGLIRTSHPRDEFYLISFDSHVYDLLDKTRDADALLARMTYVQPHGNTAVYDAVYFGIGQLERATHPKRAIILISDGEDNSSRHTLNELRRRLQESDTIIYAYLCRGNHRRLPPEKGCDG